MRVLVVGQGLAGSWTAWYLRAAGVDVHVIDPNASTTSSRVAAGLITPITGRRLHTTWKGSVVTPAAYDAYRHIEERFSVRILDRRPLRRVFRDPDMPALFAKRCTTDEFDWLRVAPIEPGRHDVVDYPFGGFEVDAATVDTNVFLDTMCHALSVEHGVIDPETWKQLEDTYDTVVWCDGWTAQHHPLWSWLPFAPVKGEILDVHIDGMHLDHILSAGIWLIPMGEARYRLGSTYDWDTLDDIPTTAARDWLLEQGRHLVQRDIVVERHRAAVRPSSHMRRPYVGPHPVHPRHIICNGFGTKGSLLTPWVCKVLAEFIVQATPLDSEIDVRQWWKA
ncbi:MAG: FAD-binding oxidoreductase [Candidatus Kapabacteria bacterium]|nr:FAD-binding oxidoreductase [Candidatus Kapabacteria bacterium]